jgi:hypothetical protein
MQGIEVPIKDVCLDLYNWRSEAHNCRYMPDGLRQKAGEINNYQPQTIQRHPRWSERSSRHLHHSSKSFQT